MPRQSSNKVSSKIAPGLALMQQMKHTVGLALWQLGCFGAGWPAAVPFLSAQAPVACSRPGRSASAASPPSPRDCWRSSDHCFVRRPDGASTSACCRPRRRCPRWRPARRRPNAVKVAAIRAAIAIARSVVLRSIMWRPQVAARSRERTTPVSCASPVHPRDQDHAADRRSLGASSPTSNCADSLIGARRRRSWRRFPVSVSGSSCPATAYERWSCVEVGTSNRYTRPPMSRTLYGLSLSPWTERARWALDHHGVAYDYHEHVPMLGEVLLRMKARTRRARACRCSRTGT